MVKDWSSVINDGSNFCEFDVPLIILLSKHQITANWDAISFNDCFSMPHSLQISRCLPSEWASGRNSTYETMTKNE